MHIFNLEYPETCPELDGNFPITAPAALLFSHPVSKALVLETLFLVFCVAVITYFQEY